MKQSILIFMMMLWAGTSLGQTTINFDDDNKWIQDGSTALSSYANHSYSDGVFTAQLTNGLRNTTTTQDGFVGALGTYSIRLKNDASKVVFTISSGGVADFNFKVRRWDGSPLPEYEVKYSIDNGTNWTTLSVINGTFLNTSNWFTYNSPTINSAVSNFKIEISRTAGERIMIDDFTWTGFASTPTVTIASASQVGASSPEQNTDNVILSFFDITVADASATLESLAFTTSGTYVAGDIKTGGFKLWKDSDNTFTGATQIGSSVSSTSGAGETITFSSLANQIAIGTAYFWITVDIASSATVGNTISASAIANSDFTFTSANKSGSVTAGGTKTIAAATVPIIVVSESSLPDFGNVVSGSNSVEATFTVSGDNLTDNVTVTAPTGFQVSTSSGSGFGASVSLTQSSGNLTGEPVTVYVRFSPATADGAFSGNVTVASAKVPAEFTTENVAVSGNALDTEPTTQASAAAVGNPTSSTLDLSWTRGNGDKVIVVMKSDSAVDSNPVDATAYTANAAFGTGTQIGTGNYVVYDGTGTSVTVTGLSSSTTYHIAVYEYNEGTGTSQNYLTSSPAIASGTTATPDWVLNEVLADPDASNGDANGDSSVSATNDEFVEFVYQGSSAINISGWKIADGYSDRHTFPSGTIVQPNQAVVVFGGGTPTGDFGSAIVQVASTTALGINNTNETITLKNDANQTVISETFGTEIGDNQSVTRDPDLTGPFVKHSLATGANGALFSPGTKIDGTAFYTPSRQITGNAGWRMLSSPKSGFTVSDISDNTAIQGIAGGSNESNDANFYYYGSSGAWTEPTNTSTAFGDGYGFITYFFNNSIAGSSPLPLTLDVTGTEPSSDVTVTLNKLTTNGNPATYYTLAGNPYASNFSLSSLTNNGDGIGANIVIWDNSAGVAGEYQDMSVATGIVAPWQGFWVSVPSTGTATSITLPTSGKTTSSSTAAYFKTAASQEIEGHFIMQYTDKLSAPFKVRMLDGASVGNDINDLAKFTSLSSVYASVAGRLESAGSLNAIEALPLELTEAVTLVVEPLIAGVSGEFQLKWRQFDTFPEYVKLELIDSETEQVYNLRENGSISFTYAAKAAPSDAPLKSVTETSTGNDRFKMVITPITTSVEAGELIPSQLRLSQNFPNPFNPSTKIAFSVPSQTQVRLAVFDMLGREVAVLVNGVRAAGSYEVTFDAAKLASGMYVYRLEANGAVLTQKMTLIK